MKKIISISLLIILLCSMIGCYNTKANMPTQEQQKYIDVIWNNKSTWETITGYFDGTGVCDHVGFKENNGDLIFTAYSFGEGSTMKENSYIVTSSSIRKMDNLDSKQLTMGLFTGTQWDSSYTQEDLTQIYLDFVNG